MNRSLFKQTFILLLLIGVADYFANTLYLYWTVWWFDMVMHFTSGACVAMAAVLVWQYYFDQDLSVHKSVVVAFLAVLVVGLSWEIFELYFEITTVSDGFIYITDTTSDIILDISGGLLGSLYAHKILFK